MIHNSSKTSLDLKVWNIKYVKNGTQCLRPKEHASKVREQSHCIFSSASLLPRKDNKLPSKMKKYPSEKKEKRIDHKG